MASQTKKDELFGRILFRKRAPTQKNTHESVVLYNNPNAHIRAYSWAAPRDKSEPDGFNSKGPKASLARANPTASIARANPAASIARANFGEPDEVFHKGEPDSLKTRRRPQQGRTRRPQNVIVV